MRILSIIVLIATLTSCAGLESYESYHGTKSYLDFSDELKKGK